MQALTLSRIKTKKNLFVHFYHSLIFGSTEDVKYTFSKKIKKIDKCGQKCYPFNLQFVLAAA